MQFACYHLHMQNDNKHVSALKAAVWGVVLTPKSAQKEIASLADLEPLERGRSAVRC